MLRVLTLAKRADRGVVGTFCEVACVHVFVENKALRSAVARWVVGRKFPYPRNEFDVDVVPVIGGNIQSIVEVRSPAVMVDVALNVSEKGLTIV